MLFEYKGWRTDSLLVENTNTFCGITPNESNLPIFILHLELGRVDLLDDSFVPLAGIKASRVVHKFFKENLHRVALSRIAYLQDKGLFFGLVCERILLALVCIFVGSAQILGRNDLLHYSILFECMKICLYEVWTSSGWY